MAIKPYNEQRLHGTSPGEGYAIEAFLPDWKASVAQVHQVTNKNHGTQGDLRLTTPGKETLKNVSSDSWQLGDFILFVIALITMLLGFVFFKHYRVLQLQLQENGG